MVDTEWGSRVAGSMFGLAYGDALGAPAEFLSYAEIMRRWDVPGPKELPVPAVAGAVAEVTDDTQMSLAVADALLDAGLLEPLLRGRFVEWWGSEDNTRAPGVTCMGACAELAAGRAWVQATHRGSKGCGANMRVTPVGLARWLDADARRGAAQLQAALTHGHPTALAAYGDGVWPAQWRTVVEYRGALSRVSAGLAA